MLTGTLFTTNVSLCISSSLGGGSALLPLPVPPVTLPEKALATRLLSRAGCSIHELNAVRTQLSQLKGGRLARLAAPAHTLAFVLSDVLGDGLDVIASGPCFVERQAGPHASGAKRALDIVNSKSLASEVPDRSNLCSAITDDSIYLFYLQYLIYYVFQYHFSCL